MVQAQGTGAQGVQEDRTDQRPAPRVAVIGLGYVGLPLAVALARHGPVTGYDIDPTRIAQLRAGDDRTREVTAADLRASPLQLTDSEADLPGHDIFIATVPTPVSADNQPDLSAVAAASRTIGRAIRPGGIAVFESTVYPGVTERFCGQWIAETAGLKPGVDFFLGYSPERINPGDRDHSIDRIVKVVAGQTPAVARTLADLYGRINGGRVFIARDIMTAEAAKAIENAQRDINIAFVNEVAMIVGRLGLSVHDVLDAARTKWNFLPFTPGLVGGHCIGVDPYYLAACAKDLGHDPQVILSGRRINDAMADYIAGAVLGQMPAAGPVLVLGLTFKEDIPDLRNSKVADLIAGLQRRGCSVAVHDPLADPAEAKALYGVTLEPDLASLHGFAAIIGAVAHRDYRALTAADLARLLRPEGVLADIKGMWRGLDLPAPIRRWEL